MQKQPKWHQFEQIAALLTSQLYPSTIEIKILSYMALNQLNGFYLSDKGQSVLMRKALNITQNQYQRGVKLLTSNKVIVKSIKESRSRYIAYKLPKEMVNMQLIDGKIALRFTFELKKQGVL